AVGRLARHCASHEATADASPDTLDDARVFVAQHQGRGPREEPLRRVDVGAADPGGVDGDERLARAGDGVGRLVDGEAAAAAPGRDLHARVPWQDSTAPRAVACSRCREAAGNNFAGVPKPVDHTGDEYGLPGGSSDME